MVVQLIAILVTLAVVIVGVGMTLDWWLGFAAGAACYLFLPYNPRY